MSTGKSRYVASHGAYGWLLPGGSYRVLHRHRGGKWFVQGRGCHKGGCNGQWFSHEALDYCKARP